VRQHTALDNAAALSTASLVSTLLALGACRTASNSTPQHKAAKRHTALQVKRFLQQRTTMNNAAPHNAEPHPCMQPRASSPASRRPALESIPCAHPHHEPQQHAQHRRATPPCALRQLASSLSSLSLASISTMYPGSSSRHPNPAGPTQLQGRQLSWPWAGATGLPVTRQPGPVWYQAHPPPALGPRCPALCWRRVAANFDRTTDCPEQQFPARGSPQLRPSPILPRHQRAPRH
jgi:hypothetical protein